eukprot:4893927-Heterocapsa_arctica.AAC.1
MPKHVRWHSLHRPPGRKAVRHLCDLTPLQPDLGNDGLHEAAVHPPQTLHRRVHHSSFHASSGRPRSLQHKVVVLVRLHVVVHEPLEL